MGCMCLRRVEEDEVSEHGAEKEGEIRCVEKPFFLTLGLVRHMKLKKDCQEIWFTYEEAD